MKPNYCVLCNEIITGRTVRAEYCKKCEEEVEEKRKHRKKQCKKK